jgi:hypothetical protein
MDKSENPAAFPASAPFADPGMSLRDWFAGQAMVGFLADGSQRLVAEAIENSGEGRLIDGPAALESVVTEQLARGFYAIADAMLAERKARQS